MIKMSEEEIRVEDENRAELRDGQPGDIPSPQKKIIDYALVYKKNNEAGTEQREIFLENLKQDGLEILDTVEKKDNMFIKLHAPLNRLKRYGNIKEIEGDELYTTIDISDELSSEEPVQSWIQRIKFMIQKPFLPDPQIMNVSQGNELTAINRDTEDEFFTLSKRARIVQNILEEEHGFKRLVQDNVFSDAYAPHDGDKADLGSKRRLLYLYWARNRNIFKLQPLDAIRDYFGEDIAFYFAWQQFYTLMLIPLSLIGVLCFVYGLWTLDSDPISNDICPGGIMADTVMCPRCDDCEPWTLKESCLISKARHVFDNEATVLYAAFLIVWCSLYQKFWKRFSAELSYRWDMDELNPRPAYPSTLRIVASWTFVIFLLLLLISAILCTIILRMYIVMQFADYGKWILLFSVGGALISAIILIVLDLCNEHIAVWLTKQELRRTLSSYEKSLAWKIYLFQLVNNCFSLVYIGFIKGQFGRPGEYITVIGLRLEECSPGGCFMELCLQLGLVFFFKQIILSGKEYYLPQLWRWYKNPHSRADHLFDIQLLKDFELEEFDQQDLSKEYLEIAIEMGYVMFSAACPLALLVALGKNLVENRFDAKKLLLHYRRPVAQEVRDTEIWLTINDFLGWVVIIINALMMTVTSDIITQWVYSLYYSEEGTLNGYVNFTLSTYDQREESWNTTEKCSYQAIDHQPTQTFNTITYTKLVCCLLCVFLFGGLFKLMISYIPDESPELKERKKKKELKTQPALNSQLIPVHLQSTLADTPAEEAVVDTQDRQDAAMAPQASSS